MRRYRAQGLASIVWLTIALTAAGCSAADDLTAEDASPSAGDGETATEATATVSTESVNGQVALRDSDGERQPATEAESLAPAAPEVAAPPTLPGEAEPSGDATDGAEPAGEAASVADGAAPTSTTVPPATDGGTNPTVIRPEPTVVTVVDGEAESFLLLNQLRQTLSLAPVTRSGELDAFATAWSKQMAESGSFVHSEGPYGENIAFTNDTTLTPSEVANRFHKLWIGDASHYENMTNGKYQVAGIGLYKSERGWYGTHVFDFG